MHGYEALAPGHFKVARKSARLRPAGSRPLPSTQDATKSATASREGEQPPNHGTNQVRSSTVTTDKGRRVQLKEEHHRTTVSKSSRNSRQFKYDLQVLLDPDITCTSSLPSGRSTSGTTQYERVNLLPLRTVRPRADAMSCRQTLSSRSHMGRGTPEDPSSGTKLTSPNQTQNPALQNEAVRLTQLRLSRNMSIRR